ncbi:MAG: hypothetical protein ACP6IP_02710 [Candidatus Njordarchaeia archaeon]
MSPHISPEICAYCKGVKKLCGAKVCPILMKFNYLKEDIKIEKSKELVVVSPPDFLVGEYGYPQVNIGPISQTYSGSIWDPESIRSHPMDLIDILKIRLNSIYSYNRKTIKVARRPSYLQDALKEMAISIKPVEAELILKKFPRPRVFLDPDIPPTGLRAPLEKIENVDNAYAPRKLESAVEEDVKATTIIPELYKHNISNYNLIRLLSLGLVGEKPRRRIVPTRWAITATDSILGNFFLRNIKKKQEITNPRVHFHEHLGNMYYILLIPNYFWSFEMFEIWLPMSVWVRREKGPVIIHIYEGYEGKPNKMDGGYYAIRFSVLEKLYKENKIASAIAIRIIKPEYFAGVGNWQIREGVRIAMTKEPIFRGNLEDAIAFIENQIKQFVQLNLDKKSRVLRLIKAKKLDYFI